jgi:hypothetical protein
VFKIRLKYLDLSVYGTETVKDTCPKRFFAQTVTHPSMMASNLSLPLRLFRGMGGYVQNVDESLPLTQMSSR